MGDVVQWLLSTYYPPSPILYTLNPLASILTKSPIELQGLFFKDLTIRSRPRLPVRLVLVVQRGKGGLIDMKPAEVRGMQSVLYLVN